MSMLVGVVVSKSKTMIKVGSSGIILAFEAPKMIKVLLNERKKINHEKFFSKKKTDNSKGTRKSLDRHRPKINFFSTNF